MKDEVERCIRSFSEQKKCAVIELNVQIDHVHLIVMVPPKVSIIRLCRDDKGAHSDPSLQQVSEFET